MDEELLQAFREKESIDSPDSPRRTQSQDRNRHRPTGVWTACICYLVCFCLTASVLAVVFYLQALGACCLPNNDCVTVFEATCASSSGNFVGFGTSCSPTLCVI